MNRRRLCAISLVVLSAVSNVALSDGVSAAVPDPANAAAQAGLVPVKSRVLDEVYLRAGPDTVGYRKVLIDPVQVALRKNWLKDLNSTRGPSRWVSPSDAEEIVQMAAASMARMVADEFAAKGYEIVNAPGAGVLRVTPSVTELDVYEPDVGFARPESAVHQGCRGRPRLILEVRDAQSGALVSLVVDRGTASQISRINHTTRTSNQFWFDAMFRLWAASCIAEMQAGPVR